MVHMRDSRYHVLSACLFVVFSFVLWRHVVDLQHHYYGGLKMLCAVLFYLTYILGGMLYFYFLKNDHLNQKVYQILFVVLRFVLILTVVL